MSDLIALIPDHCLSLYIDHIFISDLLHPRQTDRQTEGQTMPLS